MTRIITLLNEKNHYLEKFYSLNETEMGGFMEGNFERLEMFYETRERILETIKYIDSQIEASHRQDTMIFETASPDQRRRAREAMAIKDEYVARIVEQDLQVLACIESAKNTIIKELQELKKGRKAVAGYKSPTFTKRLNEEA